ncbi:hypothetical protein D1872_245910 [compost metagenome]
MKAAIMMIMNHPRTVPYLILPLRPSASGCSLRIIVQYSQLNSKLNKTDTIAILSGETKVDAEASFTGSDWDCSSFIASLFTEFVPACNDTD